MCCYFQTAVTQFAPHHTEPNRLVDVVVRHIVISAVVGRGESRGVWGMHPPPTILKRVLVNTIVP